MKDKTPSEHIDREYPLGKKFLFINTGALLINCEKWRQEFIFEDLMKLIRKYNNVLDKAVGYDEIILSLYFQNNFKVLDCRFNLTDHQNTLKDFLPQYTDDYLNNEWLQGVIRHFAGTDKPWNQLRNDHNGDVLKSFSAFWYYAQTTPFYEGLWNRFTHQLQQENDQFHISTVPTPSNKGKCTVSLFHIIPILKLKLKNNKIKIYLFGFIPLLKIFQKKNKRYYYLFNCIPILKSQTKQTF